MEDFEYATWRVALPTGQEFAMAHAVRAGTTFSLCGEVVAPIAGSRFASVPAAARCVPCVQAATRLVVPAAPPVTVPTPAPPPVAVPAPLATFVPPVVGPASLPVPPVVTPPALAAPNEAATPDLEPGPGFNERLEAAYHRLSRRTKVILAVGAGTVLLMLLTFLLLDAFGSGGAERQSDAYKDGYYYGQKLMETTQDPATSCTLGHYQDPSTAAGRDFISGCVAGYRARLASGAGRAT